MSDFEEGYVVTTRVFPRNLVPFLWILYGDRGMGDVVTLMSGFSWTRRGGKRKALKAAERYNFSEGVFA